MLFKTNSLAIRRSFASVVNSATSEKFVQKYVRVAVIGAASRAGQALCLLLKQNPVISHVFMCDTKPCGGLASDIAHVDTRCEITSFMEKDINVAVRNADVIVMLGLESNKYKSSGIKDYVRNEGPRLVNIATTCAMFAPKAIFVDCVYPVSVTLPLVSDIYRKNHWYHPGRVLGSVGLLQIQVNTYLARYQHLDPNSVHVPLLGGPDEDTILPLFTRATPSALPLAEAKILVNRFRGLDDTASPSEKAVVKHDHSPYSSAFAINRLITTIALGLLGDKNALTTAHVRSNFVDTCRHIVSTVKFGTSGMVHNYGVPRLTKFELQLFENVTLELKKREQLAKDYMEISHDILAPLMLNSKECQERVLCPEKVSSLISQCD